MQRHALTLQAVSALAHNLGNALVKGVAEGNVADNATLEECEGADTLGAVDDLVWNDKVAGLDLLLQTADGGESNDCADTDGAESGNVGARRDLMRGDLVVSTVTTEEGDGDGLVVVSVVEDGDGRRGLAPGSSDVERGNLMEAGEFAKTSSADDSDRDGVYNCQYRVSRELIMEVLREGSYRRRCWEERPFLRRIVLGFLFF